MFIIDSVAEHIQGLLYRRYCFDCINFKTRQDAVSTLKNFIDNDYDRNKQRKILCAKSRIRVTIRLSQEHNEGVGEFSHVIIGPAEVMFAGVSTCNGTFSKSFSMLYGKLKINKAGVEPMGKNICCTNVRTWVQMPST